MEKEQSLISRRDFLKGTGALAVGSLLGLRWPEIVQAVSPTSACFFPETKFSVKDDQGINFLSEFDRLGGIPILGYPISRPYEKESFVWQAFQRAILQWRADYNPPQAVLANIMDWLNKEGKDDWLYARGVPKHFPGTFTEKERLSWLIQPQITSFYFQNGGPFLFGFPTSNPERFGPFMTQRFQRSGLQLWLDKVEGMPLPGTVVPVLVGDFAKELGLIPPAALQPEIPSLKEKITLPPIIYHGDRTKPLVSLTIDDAWSSRWVSQALEIARKYSVKMTLFPVGRIIKGQSDSWRQAVAEGHEIGNHTFSHAWLTDLSEERIRWEVQASQEVLDEVLGYHYPMRLLRPPGGAGGYRGRDSRLVEIAQQMGYSVVMWSVDPLKSASVFEHVVNNTQNGDIIILHFNQRDINDLEAIIKDLKRRGFVLTTISGLFE